MSLSERLAGAMIVAWAISASATTYYVDSREGDDARDGLSPATAWQSLNRANKAALKGGDKMLFRRGGLWRGELDLKSGEVNARTYYGAYGTGPKPQFLGSVARNRPDDWFEVSPGIWSTRLEKGAAGEQVASREAVSKWSASFQNGVKGTCRTVTEKGETFLRVTCTEKPADARATSLQLWGGALTGLPSSLLLRFRVRGDFAPSRVDALMPHPPYARSAEGTLKVDEKPDAAGWRTAQALLFCSADVMGESAIHFNLGALAKANGHLDLVCDGVWRFVPNERGVIGRDVGILIFGDGTAWGVKKWSDAELKDDRDYWYDEKNDRVLVKMGGNPAQLYSSVELAKTLVVIPHRNKHDVTVEAFTVRYTGGFAFGGGGAQRVTVKNCDINFVGGGLQYWKPMGPDGQLRPVRYGNGIEYWSPASDCRVERCRFWQIYDAAVTPQQSNSTNGFDNIVFTDNVFWQCEYSYEYWNHATNSHSRGVHFVHNTSVDAGDCWSHSQRPNPNGAHLMSYRHVGEMADQTIRDNVFARSTDRGFRFFTDWRSALDMDYNLHYEPVNTLSESHARQGKAWKFGSGPEEFVRYQKATGLDAHSIYALPQFVDPAKRDYRLKPGTPGAGAASDGTDMGARNMPGLDQDQSTCQPQS